jgi:hypothetical protein
MVNPSEGRGIRRIGGRGKRGKGNPNLPAETIDL